MLEIGLVYRTDRGELGVAFGDYDLLVFRDQLPRVYRPRKFLAPHRGVTFGVLCETWGVSEALADAALETCMPRPVARPKGGRTRRGCNYADLARASAGAPRLRAVAARGE